LLFLVRAFGAHHVSVAASATRLPTRAPAGTARDGMRVAALEQRAKARDADDVNEGA
jgi:hypothetical protein